MYQSWHVLNVFVIKIDKKKNIKVTNRTITMGLKWKEN